MELPEAVKSLRQTLQMSQQAFATELGLSIRAIVNYEKDRAPTGSSLAKLHQLAVKHEQFELAKLFWEAMTKELGDLGMDKVSEIATLARDAKRIYGARHLGVRDPAYANDPREISAILDEIFRLCRHIHPFISYVEESHEEYLKKTAKKGKRK